MNSEIQELLKKTLSEIGCAEIILFGSRARADFSQESDYDILVIVEDNLSIKEKMRMSGFLRRELAKMSIDSDIIIKSKDEVDYYKDKIGSVTRSALKEGIAL